MKKIELIVSGNDMFAILVALAYRQTFLGDCYIEDNPEYSKEIESNKAMIYMLNEIYVENFPEEVTKRLQKNI